MVIYKSSTAHFDHDVRYNKIVDKLESKFIKILGRRVSDSERHSFQNSLSKMNEVLTNEDLHNKDCGVLIEYKLPQSSMRLDFMITGKDKFLNPNAVIVELKQWEKVEETNTERQVLTYIGGTIREVNHPAIQVSTYKQYLMDYHPAFDPENENAIKLFACSYLHNYKATETDKLFDDKFKPYIEDNPVFTKSDVKKIGSFIRTHVEKGDGLELLDYIEDTIPRPTKKLIDHINNIIDAKSEFILMDNQLVVFDRVMQIVRDYSLDGSDGKFVVLVRGGPGTGKSVVGLNLLAKILREGKECIYLAPNAAFKNGMANKIDIERAKRLFKHPYYYNKELTLSKKTFQTAIVDEAHRISSTPPPMQKKLKKSIVEEIISKTHLTVFFTDDNQMIRPNDIGSYSHVKDVATKLGCKIYEYELDAQFRCGGSEGYINWLDDVLGIRETANATGWEDLDNFEFNIIDDPNELRDIIVNLQAQGFNSRIVAGYAWPWSKDLDENGELVKDVKIYKDGKLIFEMPWNPQDTYNSKRPKDIPLSGADWAINPNGVNQIGCIHTCQGLEFDYVGVIMGEEFTYNKKLGKWQADVTKCYDKKIGENCGGQFLRLAQNTYKTLLTRGIKGVFVYSVDSDTMEYLKSRLKIVRQFEKSRFYHKKFTTIEELFIGTKVKAAEKTAIYNKKVTITVNKFNIRPIQDTYYFCDIHEEQKFYNDLMKVLNNENKPIEKEVEQLIEKIPQIKYFSESKVDLFIDTGIIKFEPLAIVRRLEQGKEVLSLIFKKI
ncbi:MAG TPA: DUF2075 domain-containing protein [Clostridiaceae bacterium]|nr:DUF2075 domain-containing protein [Clostridiaceae bacterium]